MNFKSLPQLLDFFKDEKTCTEYYTKLRWNGNVTCPHCNSEKPYITNRGYKCSNSECYKKFTCKTGTIFENTKVPLRLWFASIFLATAHKKGISSVQLGIDLNVSQKTAWFILHRIREMLRKQSPAMVGDNNNNKPIESDTTFIGGKEKNRHKSKRLANPETGLANDGTKYNKKKIVIGVIERNGKVILRHINAETVKNMADFVKLHVPKGATLYTDEAKAFSKLKTKYFHETVNHSLRVYVQGDIHTNTIENFWSVLKRGLYGVYHQVSDKHLERYLDEFSARFNARHTDPYVNFVTFLSQSEGGLLYKNLIAND